MAILSLGDALTLPVASATDNVDGVLTDSIIYDDSSIALYYDAISESYIITEPGIYYIYFSVTDSSNNETLFVIKITVTEDGEVVYEGYYASINGLSGEDLKVELHNIITTFENSNDPNNTTTYGDARYSLQEADVDPNNLNNVILIYNRASVSGTWDSGATWNREHVWAKSLLGYPTGGLADTKTNGPGADLHNLRAANPSINSSRGNKKFVAGSGSYGAVGSGWYPGDDDIGDVARIILYMNLRWGNSLANISDIGNLSLFIQWHLADPIDDFEINRNNVIYNYQGNRNPFIDHPELVNEVFVN